MRDLGFGKRQPLGSKTGFYGDQPMCTHESIFPSGDDTYLSTNSTEKTSF
jgi:hypothetical protein